jgi:hypothetical protein
VRIFSVGLGQRRGSPIAIQSLLFRQVQPEN